MDHFGINPSTLLGVLLDTDISAVILANLDGELVFANRAAQSILGLSPSEVVGRAFNAPEWHITDFNGDPFPEAELPFTQVMRTRQPVYNLCHAIEWPDGSRQYLSINAAPVFDEAENFTHIALAVQNITEQVLATRKAIARNEVLVAINHAEDLYIRNTPIEEIYQTILDHMVKIAGCDQGALIRLIDDQASETNFKWLAHSPDDNKWALPDERLIHYLNHSGYLIEHLQDGDPASYLMACTILAEEKPVGVFVLLAERPLFNDRLYQLIKPMLRTTAALFQVELRAQILEQTEQQLAQAQKMEAIGQLSAGIAHDINNVLASVQGHAEMALNENLENEKLGQRLRQILGSCERAADLVNQLCTFSRVSKSDLQPMDLTRLVEELSSLLKGSIPSSIELRMEFPPQPLTVLAAPTHVHQAIMNLVINARDAIEQHGRIEISGHLPQTVQGQCSSCHRKFSGTFVRLRVTDNGYGIEPQQMDRLFEPFYTSKPVGKGTGMGLAIVHGVLHECEGHIEVQTERGLGTTFDLYWPYTEAASLAPNKTQDSDNHRDDIKRILIVDDEAALAELIAEALQISGHHCQVCTSSKIAWKTLSKQSDGFDLLITDLTMPEITGQELAQHAKSLNPKLKVILVSGFHEHPPKDAKQDVTDVFLKKPIRIKQLIQTVNQLNSTNQ